MVHVLKIRLNHERFKQITEKNCFEFGKNIPKANHIDSEQSSNNYFVDIFLTL